MKSFDELKREIGNGLALVIYFTKLTDQHKKSLTLSDWSDIFKEAPLGSDISETAFQRLKEIPASVEEMAKVYENTKYMRSERSEKVTAVLANRLNNSSADPDEWLKVYGLFASSVEAPREIALKKIREFNLGFEWWKKAFNNLKTISLEEMEKKAEGFTNWLAILTCVRKLDCSYRTYSDLKERLESLSIEKIISLAKTFEDWFQIFETVGSEMKDRLDAAVKHMLELAKTFHHWVAIYMIARGRKGVKDDDLKERALRNIRELPASFDDCLKAYQKANTGRFDEEIAPALWRHLRDNHKLTLDQWLECGRIAWDAEGGETWETRICQSAYSFDDWHKVLTKVNLCTDRGIGKKAIEKMICLAESANEWFEVLQKTRCSGKYQEIALKKLGELF